MFSTSKFTKKEECKKINNIQKSSLGNIIKNKINSAKSSVSSILKRCGITVGALGIAGTMAVSSIADKSFANINNTNNKMKDVPIKTTTYDYKNIIDKSGVYVPDNVRNIISGEIYNPLETITQNLKNGEQITINPKLEQLKEVNKKGIGPIEFVKQNWGIKLTWEQIKGRLVSAKTGEILLNDKKLRLDHNYYFADSIDDAVNISKQISNGIKTIDTKKIDVIKKESKKDLINIKSFKQEKGKTLNLCSKTARQNLSKLAPEGEFILRGHAKDLINTLSKTNYYLNNELLKTSIINSKDNLFDLYIKTKNGHRAVLIKSVNKNNEEVVFVLDPYYSKTTKPVVLENYLPFKKGKHKFLLGPSYYSDKINNINSADKNKENKDVLAKNDIEDTNNNFNKSAIFIGDTKIGEVKFQEAQAKLGLNPNTRAQNYTANIQHYKLKGDKKIASNLVYLHKSEDKILNNFNKILNNVNTENEAKQKLKTALTILKNTEKGRYFNDYMITMLKLKTQEKIYALYYNQGENYYKKGITGDFGAMQIFKKIETDILPNINKSINELKIKLYSENKSDQKLAA